MQAGDLLVGAFGIVMFTVLCILLARRKPEDDVDIADLDRRARKEQERQPRTFRRSRSAKGSY